MESESVDVPADEMEPTCTDAVVCDYCSTIVKPALEHDFDDGVLTSKPNGTMPGVMTYTCQREGCSYTETREAPVSVVDSGTCGENLTWTLTNDGVLTISGTGPMEDFVNEVTYPGYSYKTYIYISLHLHVHAHICYRKIH